MKYVNTALLLTLFFSVSILHGQEVMEQENTMSLGPKYSYYVEIDGADRKEVERQWKTYVKDYGKLKYNKKAKEYYINGAKVAMINGTNEMDIYTRIEEGKDQVTVYSWVDLGGAFANPMEHNSQAEGIRTFMSDFWVDIKKKVVGDELKIAERAKEELDKDLVRLERRNESLHEDIEKFKDRIRQAEADIEENLREQDDKRIEIKKQEREVEKVVDKLNGIGKEQ